MTPFERTHPWITYQFDLRRIPPGTWMLLGEAQSKCEHISGVPLKPAVSRELQTIYLAKGALATTAIEGNTLTEDEARRRIEGKLRLPESREYLGQEIDNIVSACNEIIKTLESSRGHLTTELILDFHRRVLDRVPLEPHVVPGRFRTMPVGVARYSAPESAEVPELMRRYCEWLNGPAFMEDGTIAMAIVRAILAHVYLAWIHPFANGNGRTARLIELFILAHTGVPMPAAHLLSNHYNRTRSEYYRQLDVASASGGDLTPFLTYAVRGFVDGLSEQLDLIRAQQWDVAWRNFVHESFQGRDSKAAVRQRQLVLDFPARLEGVPIAEIRLVSPRVAAHYAGTQQKTLGRDLNALEKMGLIERVGDRVRARREVILAFLPVKKEAAASARP